MSEQFDRLVVLSVFGRKIEFDSVTKQAKLTDVDPEGTQFRSRLADGSPGFRIKFNVNKAVGQVPSPNGTSIEIYNIGEKSRDALTRVGNVIVLSAGYGQQEPGVIFRGEVSFAKTQKNGPDYVTTINAMDGIFAVQNSTIDKSFKSGTSLQAVIDAAVDSLKDQGVSRGQIVGVPNENFNHGCVISGPSVAKLRELCDGHNLEVTIQEGRLTILPYGSDRGTPVVALSPNTGLIGIPELRGAGYASGLVNTATTTESQLGQNATIAFKCLMNPAIAPYQRVLIQSKFINGLFTTLKTTYRGDSWGGEWFTECEATA